MDTVPHAKHKYLENQSSWIVPVFFHCWDLILGLLKHEPIAVAKKCHGSIIILLIPRIYLIPYLHIFYLKPAQIKRKNKPLIADLWLCQYRAGLRYFYLYRFYREVIKVLFFFSKCVSYVMNIILRVYYYELKRDKNCNCKFRIKASFGHDIWGSWVFKKL